MVICNFVDLWKLFHLHVWTKTRWSSALSHPAINIRHKQDRNTICFKSLTYYFVLFCFWSLQHNNLGIPTDTTSWFQMSFLPSLISSSCHIYLLNSLFVLFPRSGFTKYVLQKTWHVGGSPKSWFYGQLGRKPHTLSLFRDYNCSLAY